MSTPDRLTLFALGLATTAMLVGAYAVLSPPPASDPAACDCSTEALQTEIAALKRRLDAAEQTATRNTVRRVADAALEPDRRAGVPPTTDVVAGAQPDDDPDLDEPRTTPRYESFEIAEPGVTITQSESGALSVSSSNPALAGQIVVVKALGEDGIVHELPITVPPTP